MKSQEARDERAPLWKSCRMKLGASGATADALHEEICFLPSDGGGVARDALECYSPEVP